MSHLVKTAISGNKIMKSLIMKIPVRILAGVIALAFVGANEEVQAQNYYWKDQAGNGQWDWGGAQWWSSSQGNFVGAPQSDGGAIIWFENMGSQTTTINSGFTGGWFKLNSLYTAAISTGKNYVVNVGGGGTGIELYNKIETVSGGGNLTINAATQLGANSEINAVGGSLTLGELRMNGKTLNTYGASSLNIQGAIIGTGTYNIKDQGTIVTYSGNSANTFSGITTVENSSQLRLNKSANTAAIGGHLVINSGGIVRTDAAEQLNNQFVTVNGTLNLNNQNQSLALTGSGSVTLGSGTITINNMNSDSFAGIISGTGGLIKTGTGTQTLSGGNSFTGKVQINQGTLSIGAESGLGGTVASLTADQLQFAGGTLAVNTGFAMSNNRGITLNSGGGTIDVASGQTLGIGGVITGANNLTKSGSGTLTLSGANNYSGGTTISEGTLQLGNGSTTGALSASSSIINNGTLAFNRSIAVTQGTDFGLISGSGAVTTIGTGALTLGGDNTYSGTTTVATGGRLDVAVSANALGSTAAGTIVNSGGQLRLQNVTIGAEALTISGTGISGSVGAIRGGSGSSTYGGKVTLAANATLFTSGAVGLTFDVASGDAFDLGNNTLTFDGTGTHQVKDGIAGTGGLLKTGSGLLAVSGTSSYNGTTTVSNGTLRAGAAAGGQAFGNLSAVTLAASPANNTALDLNNFNQTIGSLAGGTTGGITSGVVLGSGTLTTGGDNTSTSFAGVISGTGGGLTKTGSGTMTLAAANSYTGATAVNNGLLKILSGGSISSSSTTVNSGGALDVGGTAGNVQVNSGGLLKGSGSVGAFTLASGGTLTPGNSPGTLTAASAIILGGSTYNWEISALTGTAGTHWDLFSVGGLLDMSGVTSGNKWNLVVTADGTFTGWTGTDSYSYVFAQAANLSLASGFSTSAGTDVTSLFNITTSGISSKPNASFNPNGDFKVVVGSSNGNTTLNLMAVPEPSSGSLLLAGIGSLIVLRRFRKNA